MPAGGLEKSIYRKAAELLLGRGSAAALTGAGISIESGVPAFRGTQGLWVKYDPMEYATFDAFIRHPEKVWRMMGEMVEVLERATPSPAHRGLADLETMGLLRAVITQNIDGLHQAAGSRKVIEFHGSPEELECLTCGGRYPTRERLRDGLPPRCDCGRILKPAVVLFGEPIPPEAQEEAEELARTCGVLVVVGTSAQVYPACDLPRLARDAGASVIEINPEATPLTGTITDLHIKEAAGEAVPALVAAVRELRGPA